MDYPLFLSPPEDYDPEIRRRREIERFLARVESPEFAFLNDRDHEYFRERFLELLKHSEEQRGEISRLKSKIKAWLRVSTSLLDLHLKYRELLERKNVAECMEAVFKWPVAKGEFEKDEEVFSKLIDRIRSAS